MKAMDITKNIIRVLIGAMFIISAILKLISIDAFEIYVYSFQILSFFMSELAARGLIMLEMLMGTLLILKVDYKWIWRLAMLVTIGFTLFLIYVVIFRDDENCHCFGDIIELKPLLSIFKNIVIVLLLCFIRTPNKKRFRLERIEDEETKKKKIKFSVTEEAYSLHFKKWTYGILVPLVFIVVCVLFPPNNVYEKIFKKSNRYVESVVNGAFQDSSLYLKLADVVYDEQKDTVTFVLDTCQLDIREGNYMLAVISAGCKYCKQSCNLINGIYKRNDISPETFKLLTWGSSDEQFARFMKESKTWNYEFRKISPILAIDMVNGTFPTFLLMKNGEVVDAFDYRGISENKIVNFLSNQEE